jgi:tetratricopeptide (TPR) repeat protein
MPPKRKDLLKPKLKSKAKTQDPQSENDFLEAADDFEQAAGKWRAGDAAKATRFFNRAIDMYNEGLKRYPQSFDLAYNKANLEYNITEDQRIVSQFGNRMALLEETLNSHRFAMSLKPTNNDILFNAGQVLTSLAEALLEARTPGNAKVPARSLLEEAVEIFTRCLESQQRDYEQMQAEIAKVQASGEYQEAWERGGVPLNDAQAEEDTETASASSEIPGDWATVEEPITPETILETCTAQLNALTTLLGLYDPSDIPNIEKKALDGTDTATAKIPALINLIDTTVPRKPTEEPRAGPTLSIGSSTVEEVTATPKDDALLATLNFQATIAEVAYRSGRSTSTQYAQTVEQLFSKTDSGTDGSASSELATANTRSSYADALIDLASALADGNQYTTASPTLSADLEIQWTALTQAQTLLTQLAAAPYTSILTASRLADVFLARGDVDLFRFRISLFESAKPAWVKSKIALVSNAGVFYRGARSYAEKVSAAEIRSTADAKAVVAEILKEVAGSSQTAKESWKGKSAIVAKVLEQMVAEGIMGVENVEGVLRLVA